IRAEVLTPDRLNTLVFSGLAGLALAIAVVGVAGVLAFSVSGRTREFGIRLAIGAQPRHLLLAVITEGAVMAVSGIAVGGLLGDGIYDKVLIPRVHMQRAGPSGRDRSRNRLPVLGRGELHLRHHTDTQWRVHANDLSRTVFAVSFC